jgi:N-acylneuraminate cytidylyltransferase
LIRVIETIEPIDQRQKLPKTFILNGAIYLWNTEYFLESGGFVSDKTLAFQMPRGLSIDIDTLEDFEEASNRLDRLTLQEKNRTSE